jgi:hypothetical protein
MNILILVSSLVLSTSLFAASIPKDQQIGSFTVTEISNEQLMLNGLGYTEGGTQAHGKVMNGLSIDPVNLRGSKTHGTTSGTGGGSNQDPEPEPEPTPSTPFGDRVDNAGKVIQASRDMVAFGESIYELVRKGKPTSVTAYEPISVVPRDPTTKEYVDPFELEGFSMPVEKNFNAKVTNGTGKVVVNFNYKVMYAFGGSYNETGKYLTSVLIIPGSVVVKFGWDFAATMKLSGIMNHGTKANPIAGVLVTVKYQMNSWSSSFERNDTIHINGNGELKHYGLK